jgi:GntR family transcriptional regulator/MocR family aminotransferase
MRAIYKGKHDTLLNGLTGLESLFDMDGEYAGLHVLMTQKKGVPESVLVETAANAGVRVSRLSDYYIDSRAEGEGSTVLLGYANLSVEEIEKGCLLLEKAWKGLDG